ncbi:hypothetical protein [Streptomyces longwoodensis]|uniref:hypothetical protein n=1 Tax=Streptomyces longwoodensis TaxID=68231 RepID=UPI0033DA1ED8
MSAAQKSRPKTLADLYANRDLRPDQIRRIVALLGLAEPRRSEGDGRRTAA